MNLKLRAMKKLLYSLLLTSLVLVVSSSSSFAQQERQRAKAELDVVKSEKIQSDVRKAVQKERLQQKNELKARPVKSKAKIKAQPALIRIEKK